MTGILLTAWNTHELQTKINSTLDYVVDGFSLIDLVLNMERQI